jgi:SAM-dependent methyltransferase
MEPAAPVSNGLRRVPCPVCAREDSRHERTIKGFRLERCAACRHVFVNPQPSMDDVADLYVDRDNEPLVDIYERIALAPSVRAEYLRRLAMLERLLPGRGRLLDFACGAGAFFELAQQHRWDAHGTELGRWAAEAAKRRGVQNLHVGRLADIAFPDGYFDVVYAAQVFEHLPNPGAELAEIRRVLRPGGLLYIDVPNYQTLSIVLGRDDFMLNEPPQHINYFVPASLGRLVRSASFVDVRISTDGGLKWENLFGRSINSEIKDAYEIERPTPAQPPADGSAAAVKQLLLKVLVKPVLYDRLKVGMKLVAIARRP